MRKQRNRKRNYFKRKEKKGKKSSKVKKAFMEVKVGGGREDLGGVDEISLKMFLKCTKGYEVLQLVTRVKGRMTRGG